MGRPQNGWLTMENQKKCGGLPILGNLHILFTNSPDICEDSHEYSRTSLIQYPCSAQTKIITLHSISRNHSSH